MPSDYPEATWWNGDPERRHDPNQGSGSGGPYVCRTCAWEGCGEAALQHHLDQPSHQIRGKRWPESFGFCLWSDER